jgi:phage antirepressor YoqD-like protein
MQIQPFNQPSAPTISSLEIAQRTGKPHRNVTADIERILSEAKIDAQGFLHIYKDGKNRDQKCFNLPRFECDLVVSGYSVKYRAEIIKRWHELEAEKAAAFQIPSSFAEALRLAADQSEKIAAQKLQLEAAAPKVAFHDTVTASNTVVLMAVAAQTAKLPFGQNTLFQKLREIGALFSGGKRHNLPKQEFVNRGYFTVNERPFENSSGEPQVAFTTHVTQKGIAWLVKTFGRAEQQLDLAIQS